MKTQILFIAALLCCLVPELTAQNNNKLIRSGNNQYNDSKFKEAEIDYRKALEKFPASVKALNNLGNSIYKQGNYEESSKYFSNAASMANQPDKNIRSGIFYNFANSQVKAGNYEESIENYKNALRLNPNDEDARYNLVYAMRKLKEQQDEQSQGQGKQDNMDNKDDQKQQQQDQSEQSEQSEQDQQNKSKPQAPQISKQDAERMLQALKNDEQKTLDKVNRAKGKSQRSNIEKDW